MGVLPAVLVTIVIFFSATKLHAQQLSDDDWMAYFGVEETRAAEFKISGLSLFGPQEYRQRVKPKGTTSIEGKKYRKSVILHDGGPLANRTIEIFIRLSEDGLYERQEDGTERLITPRPLSIGQTWTYGKEILTFEGIEDLETFNATVHSCAKF
jgi:hypothetical protein